MAIEKAWSLTFIFAFAILLILYNYANNSQLEVSNVPIKTRQDSGDLRKIRAEYEKDHAAVEELRLLFSKLTKKLNISIEENDIQHANLTGHIGDLAKSKCEPLTEPIDVVFTWVNGSDPKFLQEMRNADLGANTHRDDMKPQRFEDFNQLVYSMRSIEMYAPWVRHIFIVTNGQIPVWLDLSNPGVSIVTHKQIFNNSDDLPTFNSMAIEVHLQNILGLSEKYIYFNDDISFTKSICLSDFWTPEKGYKLYESGYLGDKVLKQVCSEDCVSVKMSDGFCDQECNSIECNWDGDDCDGITPKGGEKDHRPAFYQAVDFVNVLYQRTLSENKRHWLPHVPYMFNKKIVLEMQANYQTEFEITSKHKKRQKNDMQTEFSYIHWVIEAPKSSKVKVDKEAYKHEAVGLGVVGYVSYWNSMARNKPQLENVVKNKNLKFLCINDLMEHEKRESVIAKAELEKFYNILYPIKSSFEL